MRSGTVYQLPRLALTTTEIGSGFWPTPMNSDWKNMDTANQTSLSSTVKLFPTPAARDYKGGEEAGNNGKDRQEPRNQLITGLGGVQGGVWEAEPNVGRVANGVPARSHRLRCLGNAVVPQIPELIGRQIMEAERGGS